MQIQCRIGTVLPSLQEVFVSDWHTVSAKSMQKMGFHTLQCDTFTLLRWPPVRLSTTGLLDCCCAWNPRKFAAALPRSWLNPCMAVPLDSGPQQCVITQCCLCHCGYESPDCMSAGGLQVGPCRGEVSLPGLGLQWHVLRVNHGPGPVPPYGGDPTMAVCLLCLRLHWDLLVPGMGEKCLQLAGCGRQD